MQMTLDQDKQQLRQRLIRRLLALTKEEIKRRSKNVEDKLSDLLIYKQAKVVMAYYPLRGEVDILKMIKKAKTFKRFCFPVMDLKAKGLRIFEVNNLDEDFISGPFGVIEPDVEKTKELSIKEIDIVIVPGLGFDYHKNRLGRGAGFYDRFLEKITPSIKKVGIAFEFQILESLPIHLSLDQKLDVIVSESFVI
ncbi:MAG: 5-formyltetrahydrofolate cyclo-ligase [Omnitrophica bacterium]|nr:5-formyltetrahydrofolate cyclo-ligase [Candidatus Omnitrophota bacterium]